MVDLRRVISSAQAALRRFEREAKALATLRHPNIGSILSLLDDTLANYDVE